MNMIKSKSNFFSLGTQIPQATSVAYSLKMDKKKDAYVITYMGEGCTIEVI